MIIEAEIKGVKNGELWFSAPLNPRLENHLNELDKNVAVELTTVDSITAKQRRKAYVLIKFISEWWGYTPMEAAKEISKLMFAATGETLEADFSLSDCSKETAKLYITYLIDFCLMEGIPCGEPLYKLCEDVPRYVWVCAVNKRCAVCGGKAELHHYDSVGTGRNRKEICHIGMRCLPLCRRHHQEIHRIGRETFVKRYILEPVHIDEKIAGVFKLRGDGIA
ncbi:putative HNHc nuclease [Anaerovibrio sp. RM50]|uniref:putative HNHc nuclease n=1 Tax=Anaerovibrio sp. RM50 TaxID=1200557 RepID=UPI0004847B24|nr:putative HNHc nuclease [Anaerovibrio sp. RM50]